MTEEQKKTVLLAHGGGGRLTSDLIDNTIVTRFKNDTLTQLTDAAYMDVGSSQILFTTDSFVVKPLFFNGGDIGKLAICGTVNDLAVSGAIPKALSLSLIIEEGLPMETLETILSSAAATAEKAGVPVVTGDTKVVERSAADGIFINTAGIGTKIDSVNLSFDRITPGDKIIINGTIGDHGMTIMSQREGINFDSPIKSDCACLNDLVAAAVKACPDAIKFMRDPTRGGVAATLNEVASSTGLNIELSENALPVDGTVRAAADMLGFDLLDIANEGKVIMVVAPEAAEDILQACKGHPLGSASAVIGTVLEADESVAAVEIVTAIGGRRVVQMPYGRELPRIC